MTASIRLERTLAAAPSRVWDAWTRPADLDHWICPDPDLAVVSSADLREGGAFRVNMGGGRIASGQYGRLDAPRVLECTWRWEHETAISRLRLELRPDGEGTALTLTHSDIARDEYAADVQAEWERRLDRLAALLDAAG